MQGKVNPFKLALWGSSLGGGHALVMAAAMGNNLTAAVAQVSSTAAGRCCSNMHAFCLEACGGGPAPMLQAQHVACLHSPSLIQGTGAAMQGKHRLLLSAAEPLCAAQAHIQHTCPSASPYSCQLSSRMPLQHAVSSSSNSTQLACPIPHIHTPPHPPRRCPTSAAWRPASARCRCVACWARCACCWWGCMTGCAPRCACRPPTCRWWPHQGSWAS